MVRESPSGGAGYITTSSQWQLPLSFPERRKKLLDTCERISGVVLVHLADGRERLCVDEDRSESLNESL